MSRDTEQHLPAGHQPYDPANGLRVGGFVGAVVGAAVTAVTGTFSVWLIALFAAVGAAVGHRSEKRRLRPDSDDTTVTGRDRRG